MEPLIRLDPARDFSKGDYLASNNNMGVVEQGLEKLARDNNDVETLRQVGKDLHGSESHYSDPQTYPNPGLAARNDLVSQRDIGKSKLTDYVMAHSQDVFGLLNQEGQEALLLNSKLEKTSDNKEYNNFVEDVQKYQKLMQIAQNQDPRQIGDFVSNELMGKKGEGNDVDKEAYKFMSGNDRWVQGLFQDYIARAQMKAKSHYIDIKEQDGEPTPVVDKDKLENFAKTSLRNAEDKGDKKYFEVLNKIAYNSASN